MSTTYPNNAVLSTLFGKTRRSILALLYSHPDESFYMRQILRTAGIAPGAGQRELNLLTESGIIRRTVSGNQVYYQANPECPIFWELKNIITKTVGIADIIRAQLVPIEERINIALLFGSVVQGKESKDSDIDILIVGDLTFAETVEKLAPVQKILGREINPTVFSSDEFRDKLKKGHHFLNSVLKSDLIYLIGDEIELKRLAKKRMAD
ncbi:MAG: nucleotidyltransferase domain-containing protein [Candidatus Aminicenantes bacterium]|nr:MAG: nucleotidyltransferase domain-containing protein [Candidatus Aminicenantes bacterium]